MVIKQCMLKYMGCVDLFESHPIGIENHGISMIISLASSDYKVSEIAKS